MSVPSTRFIGPGAPIPIALAVGIRESVLTVMDHCGNPLECRFWTLFLGSRDTGLKDRPAQGIHQTDFDLGSTDVDTPK